LNVKNISDTTAERMDTAIANMIAFGSDDSGDTLTMATGTLTDARIKGDCDSMVIVEIVDSTPGIDESFVSAVVTKRISLDIAL